MQMTTNAELSELTAALDSVRLGQVLSALAVLQRHQENPVAQKVLPVVLQQCESIHAALAGFSQAQQWKRVLETPSDQLEMRYTQQGRWHSVLFTAVYECEPSTVLSLAREFDLLPSWNKYISSCQILQVKRTPQAERPVLWLTPQQLPMNAYSECSVF